MTGFAERDGAAGDWQWRWEIRSVNGRGLDLRVRLAEAAQGLEPALRAALRDRVVRGSVTVSLRLTQETAAGDGPSDAALERILDAARRLEAAAARRGLAIAPSSAAALLGLRAVATPQAPEAEAPTDRIAADMPGLLAAFDASRRAEGAELHRVLSDQVDAIEVLVAEARATLGPRAARQAAALREALDRLRAAGTGVAEDRLAQELAVVALRSDVTEELDRLGAHVAAARAELATTGPKGRKLDFLTQELNREANTLCAKSADGALTRIGLALKHEIDRIREQVQNVE